MKKFLLSLIALLGMSAVAVALPNSTILLQHQGHVVHYPLDSLNAALRDAVDGDTLFLSKGTYSGFTIDKKITVRGAGQETMLSGDVTIAIPGAVTLTATVLENLWVGKNYNDSYGSAMDYNVKVTLPVSNMRIKQCRMGDLSFRGKHRDVSIDRCLILGEFSIPNSTENAVHSMVVNNSAIYTLRPTEVSAHTISFVNCTIRGFYFYWGSAADNFRGSFINTVLGGGSSQHNLMSATLINTLFGPYVVHTSTYQENCYKLTDSAVKENTQTPTCIYSDEELMEKGYIGNDGTVIGCNGGAMPYTLVPAVPVVTESDVKLDADKRELNVKLTLTAN